MLAPRKCTDETSDGCSWQPAQTNEIVDTNFECAVSDAVLIELKCVVSKAHSFELG